MASKTFDFSNRPQQKITPADLPGLFSGLGNMAAPGTIVQLSLNILTPYDNPSYRHLLDGRQSFRPYSEAKFEKLVSSIKTNGVLTPIIVRPWENGKYQVLAGHNRWNASRAAGLDTIPAIIDDADDDRAAIIMTTTNIDQRDELLPSEKAWAYRLQLDVMKRQGQRTDLTSAQSERKLSNKESREILAEQTGENRNQIQRYIRLTYLIPELLEMVDKDMLPMVSGVALSYLDAEQQSIVCDISAECDKRISTAQAEQIKRLAQSSNFTAAAVKQILLPAKRWNPANAFSSRTKGLIPKTATEKDIEQVAELIEDYFEGKERSDT